MFLETEYTGSYYVRFVHFIELQKHQRDAPENVLRVCWTRREHYFLPIFDHQSLLILKGFIN